MLKNFAGFRAALLILTLIIGLGAAANAIDVTPARSVLNPVTHTLYFADNHDDRPDLLSGAIHVYKIMNFNTWIPAPDEYQDLPTGSKCYGMAVSADGKTLYAGANAGSKSKIMIYDLDLKNKTGYPKYNSEMTGTYFTFVDGSSPAGMTLAGSRLFVADKNIGRILVFNTTEKKFEQAITDQVKNKAGLYDVAAYSAGGRSTTHKIFVSRKTSAGEIYVYNYNALNKTVAYLKTITHPALNYPTYLKVVENKLYVAVNGAKPENVLAFDVNNYNYIGAAASGISGAYDWVAFDVDKTGKWLVFKKAANIGQSINKLYKIVTYDIKDGKTVAATEITNKMVEPDNPEVIKSDGIVLSWLAGKYMAALTFSPDGTSKNYYTGEEPHTPDFSPEVGEVAYQYEPDGKTLIKEGGTTNKDYVIIKFQVVDLDEDFITPIMYYSIGDKMISYEGTAVRVSKDYPGTWMELRIPESGSFADNEGNGEYGWHVWLKDPVYGENVGYGHSPAFIVKSVPDFQVTKTYPADTNTNIPVNAPFVVNFNREVDTKTFSLNITQGGGPESFNGAWSNGNTRVVLTHNTPFDVDKDYVFEVSAMDVLTAQNLAGKKSFTFKTSASASTAPYIMKTSPTDEAQDVAISQPIKIIFSQPIKGGVNLLGDPNFAFTCIPDPGGWKGSLNGNVATLTHNNFDVSMHYKFEVTLATGENGKTLIPGPASNPFIFKTGSSAVILVSDPAIIRDGDKKGDSITLSWKTDNPTAVDIYTKTGDFSALRKDWPEKPEYANIDGTTKTDLNQVGQGTAKYYKIVLVNEPLDDEDLKKDVIGKFDLEVGVEPEKFFISIPLDPGDTSIENVLGNQVMENDWIGTFKDNEEINQGSYYKNNAWILFPADPPVPKITKIEPGYGYGYFTSVSRYITVVGNVIENDFSRPLTGGKDADPNWVGSPYPVSIDIANAGLNNTNYSSNIADASKVFRLKGNAEAEGEQDGLAFHKTETLWTNGTFQDSSPSPLKIKPGKGYYLRDSIKSSLQWTLKKPY